MDKNQKKKVIYLISFIMLVIVVVTFLFLIYKDRNIDVENISNNNSEYYIENIGNDDSEYHIENEIVVSDFHVEYNYSDGKWNLIFSVDKDSVKTNYDDYYIYFYDYDDNYLGFAHGNILNSLKEGKSFCNLELGFDGSLIKRIVIKKESS